VTTAAGIWLTATVGVVTGMGRLTLAITGGILAYLILTVVGRLEQKIVPRRHPKEY
jgi:putative Mg2+ transporter-C (MgtC) family protein